MFHQTIMFLDLVGILFKMWAHCIYLSIEIANLKPKVQYIKEQVEEFHGKLQLQ